MAETGTWRRFAFHAHWRSVVFNALAVAFFVVAGYLLLSDSDWANAAGRAGIAFLCAVFCGLIGNLEHFESFKASPTSIEAKLREAQVVIDDAKATVASLHELATMTGAFLVDNIAGSGRYGGQGTIQQKDAAKGRLVQRLKAIGLSDDALREVFQADRHWVCIDYVHGIFILPTNQSGWSKLVPEDSKALRQLMEQREPATPEECESMLKRLEVNDAFTTELLEDYRHYVRTGEQRRPAVWRHRASWPGASVLR